MTSIQLKRAYEAFDETDGFRILVDRLWPRGIKKESAHIDLWLKDIAPSPELRKWFGHDPEKFAEFKAKYMEELTSESEKIEAVNMIKTKLKESDVTLVFGAKDVLHNQAVVLKDYIK